MEKRITKLLLLIQILFVQQVVSQTTVPDVQLPNVATLNKFIDFPVDKSTGIPTFSIPIYTIKERDILLPVSLSYHAGGIKVEDRASNVGLGWALSAEATMSRTVKGLPDEASAGYYTHQGPYTFVNPIIVPPQSGSPGYIINQMPGNEDTEPDLFYFNVGGYSGKFVFDTSRVIRLIPEQDIKIEVTNTPNISSSFNFKITTPDGMQYEFYDNKDYYQLFGTGASADAVISGWHVNIITTANNNVISFTYQEDGSIANRMIQHESMITGHSWCPTIQNAEWRQSMRGYTINRIQTEGTEILFNYKSSVREDIRPDDVSHTYAIAKALDNIMVKDRVTGDTVKRISIITSYFVANETSVIANDDYLKKRLRLDELKEYKGNGDSLAGYKFSYNKYNHTASDKLPNRVSTAQDHWGYYNGKASNASLYPSFTFFNMPHTDSSVCSGANRNPDTAYKKAFILDEIVFPTGGYTKYIYECTPSTWDTFTVGGLRIKEIYNTAGANAPEVKTSYTYENAQLVGGLPIYAQYVSGDDGFYDYEHYPECSYWQRTWQAYMVYTNPVNYSGEVTSNYIYFEKVTATKQNNGSIESYYDIANLSGEQDLGDAYNYPSIVMQPLLLSQKLLREVYKNSAGNLLKETEYIYGNYTRLANSNAYILHNPFCIQRARTYSLPTGAVFLVSKKETDYMNEDNFLTKETFYEYGAIPSAYDLYYNNALVPHHFVTKQMDVLYDTIITRSWYPQDYNTSYGFIGTLISKHVLGIPVEKTISRKGSNEFITDGQLLTFDNTTGLNDKIYKLQTTDPIPYGSYTPGSMSLGGYFSIDGHYKEQMSFNGYDNVGNLREIQKTDDIKGALIWNYKQNYITADVKNADTASIAYTSFEVDSKGGWTYSGSTSVSYFMTGLKSYNCSNGDITAPSLPSKTYIVSYWGKNGSVNVNGAGPTRTGKTIGNWTYYESEVTSGSITVSGSNYIDELRLYPKGAQMKTYAYKPLVGIISFCNETNKIIYYEYDQFNRLILIRDEDGNVLKRVEYGYQKTYTN